MSIRLQVILENEEMKEIKKLAEQEKMTVSAWVRRAIAHEKRERPTLIAHKKIDVIRKASQYNFPSGDIDTITAEIESGYLSGPNP
jgi:hypothetical protein